MKPSLISSVRLITGAFLALCVVPLFAQTAPVPSAATKEDAVKLDPFNVSADSDVGFVAASSLAGGRIATALKDTPVAYSVITKEFLEAFNITNMQDAAQWTTNSNATIGDGTDQSFGTQDSTLIRIRGVKVNTPTRNFFPYITSSDSFNIDRVDFARGANAILFGAGGNGGTQNSGTKQANPARAFQEVRVQAGSWNRYRMTADFNQPLSTKFAVRVNVLWAAGDTWRDREWEDKQGFHIAATYKMTPKITVRGEFEYTKTVRMRGVAAFRDQVSAWDGKTVDFDAPLTGTGAPTPAFLAQTGLARTAQRFVIRPDHPAVINWQNEFRTVGAAHNTTAANTNLINGVPIKTVGFTLRGQAMIDVFNDQIRSSRFSTTIAGSPFFRVPTRSDTALWDTKDHQNPTYQGFSRDAAVYVSYAPFDGLFLEVAGDANQAPVIGNNAQRRGLQDVFMDLNRTLPTGESNPWFLHQYTEHGDYKAETREDFENARFQAVYVKDTRIGKLQVGTMAGINKRKTRSRSSLMLLPLTFITADARSWIDDGEQNAYFQWIRVYDDEADRNWAIPSTRPVTVVDPTRGVRTTVTPSFMYDSRRPDNNFNAVRDFKYLQLAGNFNLFKNRLVIVGAFRRDSTFFSTNRIIASADNPAGWDGLGLTLRAAPPTDYQALTYIPKNTAGAATGTEQPADTRPRSLVAGVNVPLPQYAKDRFRDDYDAPDVSKTVNTKSIGAVINVAPWLGVYANRSTTFDFNPAYLTINGTLIPPTASESTDAGIRITLPNGKLAVSLGWYKAFQKNAWTTTGTAAGGFTGAYSTIGDTPLPGDLLGAGRNKRDFKITSGNNIVTSYTNDTHGYEFEATANLTRSWRLILNAGYTDAASIDLGLDMRQYIPDHDAVVRLILADSGILIDAQNQASINPALNDPTKINIEKVQASVDAWNSLVNTVAPNLDARSTQKLLAPQSIKWVGNLATDYRFQSGKLQGLRVGLGVNYRGGQVIGYRGADTINDPNNPGLAIDDPSVDGATPLYAKAYYSTTGTLSYVMRLKEARKYFPKTIQFDVAIDNLLGRYEPVYGYTGVQAQNTPSVLNAPRNGSITDPARISIPGNFFYLAPRNFTVSAKMNF